ncbi:MAG TPA: hypothetical protein VKB60_11630 [Terriglobales bacterium]|nr:hypothetical protein [Terriglobales bacterium]
MAKPSAQRHLTSGIDEAQVKRDSRRRLLLVMAGFAVAAFLITELMHYLLVPDLGPYRERIMAEGGSALILGMLAAKLLHNAYKARQYAMARLRVIAELNHHVRNALEVISLSAYITRDEEAIRRIMEGVNRIDWALREILPRENFPIGPGEPPASASASPGNGTSAGDAQGKSDSPEGQMLSRPIGEGGSSYPEILLLDHSRRPDAS